MSFFDADSFPSVSPIPSFSPQSFSHVSIDSDEAREFGGRMAYPLSPVKIMNPPAKLMENFTVESGASTPVRYSLSFVHRDESAILSVQFESQASKEELIQFPYHLQHSYLVRSCGPDHDCLLVVYDGVDGPYELFQWSTVEPPKAPTAKQLFHMYVNEEKDLDEEKRIAINFRVADKVFRHFFLPTHTVKRVALYGDNYSLYPKFEMIHLRRKIAVEDFDTTLRDFGFESEDTVRIFEKVL